MATSLLQNEIEAINRPSQRLFQELNQKQYNPEIVCKNVDLFINKYKKQFSRVLTYVYLMDFLLNESVAHNKAVFERYWNKERKKQLIDLIEHYHGKTEAVSINTIKTKWKLLAQQRKIIKFVPWFKDESPEPCDICKENFQLLYDHDNECWYCFDGCLINDQILRHQKCDSSVSSS